MPKRGRTRASTWVFAVAVAAGIGCSEDTPFAPGRAAGGAPTALSALRITVSAPNGDAISGATVWIDQAQSAAPVKLRPKADMTDPEGNTCEEAPESAFVAACTNAEGLAILSCDGLSGPVNVHFSKGSFAGVVEGNCTVPGEVTAWVNAGATDIAVVTGQFDTIQDVLAKLGFGTVSSSGHLELGSETFTLYDGDESLGSEYDDFADVLLDPTQLAQHDIIFINCDEFGLGNELALDTSTRLSNLRAYVENGGKLYVTDLSYDYVEQPFPEYTDFFGAGSGAVAEAPGAAELGFTPSDPNAVVNDPKLAEWLDKVRVNSGNPDTNCWNPSPNATTGARNEDGSIFIGDLLGGWALIDGGEVDAPSNLTEWIIGTDLENAAQRPLTVTFDVGQGRVLYTSYHTAHSCPSKGFWPQERVLQFLVFAL